MKRTIPSVAVCALCSLASAPAAAATPPGWLWQIFFSLVELM